MQSPAERPVFTVSALARQARLLIEERFNIVQVEGEISNFSRPASGHWYFTLKDDSAQIRCAMFAGRNRNVRPTPRNGNQVLIRGRVSLYEARGDFQIIVDALQPAGEGALRAAFEELKMRLAAEGLFDDAGKATLPSLPRHLTIISSASGAALQDVLHVIERRFPALAVTLLPTAVQGAAAEPQILAALARASRLTTDVVLITRGGGSLEDLWAFNLESVARAIADCPHPVVAAIGHQTDITIADYVADIRAPTPSAGAELITPAREELESLLRGYQQRAVTVLLQELRFQQTHLGHLGARLIDPRQILAQRMQQADDLEARLILACRNTLANHRSRLRSIADVLKILQPARQLPAYAKRLSTCFRQLHSTARQTTRRLELALAGSARALQAVSPLATLSRGYAVLTSSEAGSIGSAVTSVRQVSIGAALTAHLHDGALELSVEKLDEDNRLPEISLASEPLPTTRGTEKADE